MQDSGFGLRAWTIDGAVAAMANGLVDGGKGVEIGEREKGNEINRWCIRSGKMWELGKGLNLLASAFR